MPATLAWLITLTCRSSINNIWHDSRVRSFRSVLVESIAASFSPIGPGSPDRISTRHVVQRALPPQRCRMSMPASSIASTSLLPFSASKATVPPAVSAFIFAIKLSFQLSSDFARAASLNQISPCADLNLLPVFVYCDEGEVRRRHPNLSSPLAEPFRLDLDVDG